MNASAKSVCRASAATAIVLLAVAAAKADPLSVLKGAAGETKPLLDFRLRLESVDQEPFSTSASALTLRGRMGFETGKAWNTALLAEGEFLVPLQSDYNSTTNGKTQFPIIADPRSREINRLQLTNTSLPGTTITFGRQRINLDDQRFVGNVGWRSNEQTFDALRVVNRSVNNLVIDVSYLDQVNRVFGPDGRVAPNFGRLHGDNYLANVAYQTRVGKLTAFWYVTDFEEIPQPLRDSTSTYGLRFAGDRPLAKIKLSYMLSIARQKPHLYNPLVFENDYYAFEFNAIYRKFSFGVGMESLGGNGTKGFSTPLATLHKFQGWADKFLTTPVNGLNDRYVSAGYLQKGVGQLETLSGTVIYHDYRTERLSLNYGSEIDLQLQAKRQRFSGTLKYARYNAQAGTPLTLRDTSKLWAQLDFLW